MKGHLVQSFTLTVDIGQKSALLVSNNSYDMYTIIKDYVVEMYPVYKQKFKDYNYLKLAKHLAYFIYCWVGMGVVRYLGADTKFPYSLYHQKFNENLLFTGMEMIIYSAILEVFIEVFEWDLVARELGFNHKQKDLSEFVDFFLKALFTKRLFYILVQDLFYTRVKGIPLIQRKLSKYGFDRLSKFEKTNYNMIY